MKNNIITCEWMGRLGNVMFQIAVTYALAEKFGVKPQFSWQPHFDLPERTREPENIFVQPMGNNKVMDIQYKPNLSIIGFFQRHEYFDNIREKLINEVFKVPNDWHPNTIAIHVRRGDFLMDVVNFPTQPKAYYMQALNRIGIKGKKIVFCSDDIDWCKETFKDVKNTHYRVATEALDDIFFMANCDYVIMSNSTFSFWGAYLSTRERQIYFPLHWFDKKSGRTGYEICLNEWIGL